MATLCWHCGMPLPEDRLPIRRTDACADCRADLHVCRSCRWYDPRVAKQCREPIAEAVTDKTRANFCDYFEYRPDAYQPKNADAAQAARAELDALFGANSAAAAPAETAASAPDPSLEDLFKKSPKKT